MGVLFLLVVLVVAVLFCAYWMIYKKIGGKGWEFLIPFYGMYFWFKQIKGNGWKFLLLLIPLFNIYYAIKVEIDYAHYMGYSTAFGWGVVFCPCVFQVIVGWGDNKEITEEDFISEIVCKVKSKITGHCCCKEEGANVCPKCGNKYNDGDAFCEKCGEKLN